MPKLPPVAILKTLVTEAGYTMNEVTGMSRFEIVDAWLRWEGIIGYTQKIINLCDSTKESVE